MKKSTKLLVVGLIACALALPLGACGLKVEGDVSVAKKTVKLAVQSYVSKMDLLLLDQLGKQAGQDLSVEALGLKLDELDTVTIDGKEYYTSTDPAKGLYETQKFTKNQLAKASCILDKNKFVMYGVGIGASTKSALEKSGMGSLGGLSTDAVIDFSTYTLNFDKKPIASNGKRSGKKVTYSGTKLDFVWAAFTKKASKAKASSIKPSVKNKAFTKKSLVTFKTPGIIKGYTVDGKKLAPSALVVNTKLKLNTVEFAKQGKHKVTVKLTSKAKKTFTFTYDKGKPKANVKAKKSYKKGKRLTVKDKYGLKSVKLDGKKVKVKGKKASTKLKKSGSHKLVAKDKAGNTLTVKFKVK